MTSKGFPFGISVFLAVFFLANSCSLRNTSKLMQAGFVKEESFLETVSFERRIGLPVIQAEINGKKGWFLFDTGAPNVISSEFREEFQLETKLKNDITDSGGNVSKNMDYVCIEEIKIGDITFQNTGAIVQDMHTSDVFRCLDVDGIIGANLMRQAFWNLDYKNQEIIFSDSLGALPLDSSYLEIGFVQMTQGTPKVNFVINDVEAKNIIFDTGSNRGFLFPLSILKEMRGLHNLKESIELGSTSYGIGGASKADSIFHVRVDRISMGSMQLPSSVISFDKHSNTFGTEVLEQFNIILDWEGNRIYLKPISEFILNLETHGFGVNMSDGHFEVGSIFLDSDAKDKLIIGDRIVEVEEFDLENSELEVICKLMVDEAFRLEDRPRIKLTIDRQGVRKELELKRYELSKPK
ncbi:MAG: retroviral-like aspartic protease family protein [Flavobacteriales bacterium]|nr:retroviral-like aspartic protease family protein [Flavobacteriales bacterium]